MSERALYLYIWCLLLAGLAFQISYPIIKIDTDMWYHLNGGRYFWETLQIPDSSFFSFIEPPLHWQNYYWGFQALIYKLYELGGYGALLGVRALIFFASTLVLYRFLFHGRRNGAAAIGLLVLLIGYFLLLEGRSLQLRPHVLSYLFILLFLYVLEHRQRLALWLPLIALLWANLHGIEYPVPALIAVAYLLEAGYARLKGDGSRVSCTTRCVLAIGLCGTALLATPHGLGLVMAPFEVSPYASKYILEMAPISLAGLYHVSFTGPVFGAGKVFPLLFLFSCYAVIRSALDGSHRPAHLIMFLGGLALLTKGTRFIWEWALLSLPLLTAFVASRPNRNGNGALITPLYLLLALVLLIPFSTLWSSVGRHSGYPFSQGGLPVGTTRFLENTGQGGRILAPAGEAGFTQWRLYPKYRIYADLQNSLFNEWQFFEATSAYRSRQGLETFVGRYRPDYISVPWNRQDFPDLISAVPRYVPVFFDDNQVLYMDRDKHPALAEKNPLKAVNPHSLLKGPGTAEEKIQEIKRVARLQPNAERVNHALSRLLFDAGRFEEALTYARKFAEFHPLNPNAEFLMGNTLENLNRCEEAIPHFDKALSVSDAEFSQVLERHIGACYYLLKEFGGSYQHLWAGLNPFKRREAPEDMYQLAFSAVVMGQDEEAELLLRMLVREADPEKDVAIVTRANGLLADIREAEKKEEPGVLSWINSLIGQ